MKNGWEIKKLGEVCEVIAGQSPEGIFYNSAGEGLPFYQGKKEFGNKFIGKPTTWTTKTTKEAVAGDILMSVRAPVGPVNFSTQNICIGRGLAAIRAGKLVDKEFLFNFFLKLESTITGNAGAVFDSINKSQIEAIEIPVPPLSEQQRIVTILNKAFAALDKAKANAEQNLKNARELFESCLQEVFENKGDEYVVLSQLATDITDGDHMPPPKTEFGIPFITISDINKTNNRIDFSDTFSVSESYYQQLKPNRKPRKGDILYTVTGSFGIPVLVEDDTKFCFQRHIGLIRPNQNVASKWLFYWIMSPKAIKQADDSATGAAQRTVSLTALRNFVVPKVSLTDQQLIVQKLDAISTQTRQLESIYRRKIADLEEMRKSVLQQAFSGEL